MRVLEKWPSDCIDVGVIHTSQDKGDVWSVSCETKVEFFNAVCTFEGMYGLVEGFISTISAGTFLQSLYPTFGSYLFKK